MFKKLQIILIGIILIFIFSCAQDSDIIQIKRNIYALNSYNNKQNKKIYELETEIKNLKEDYFNFKKKQKAEFDLKINALELEIKSLRNQLNDISNLTPQPNIEAGAATEEVTREAIKDIFAKLSDLQSEIDELKNKIKNIKNENPEATSESVVYKKAISLFKAGKYNEAQKQLENFIKLFPKSKLLPNAYYWLGETYFKRKMYEKAIINYDEVIVKFPKSPKVPAALLKEGISFMKIGEKEGAKIIFKKILTDYPKSPQAKYAKIYLRQIK